MSKRQDIVCRGESFNDDCIANPWRWEWCDKTVNGRRLGEFIRKLDKKGQSWCSLCEKEVSYASRGYSALSAHVNREIHREKLKLRQENQTLPGNPVDNDKGYGVHPSIAITCMDLTDDDRRVPIDDRAKNQEAMILSFIAENNLPLSISTPLLEIVEQLMKDPEAFRRVCLERTTASYKMKYGLAKTIMDDLLESLRNCKFSLNIDEAMNAQKEKILTILCSHYDQDQNKVLTNHLASIEMVTVSSESLFNALDDLFSTNNLPWENLVSILMDSCNVMRGSKSGLEKRIRDERAPHLLDIDGDTCHHAHNAAKAFCKPFGLHVESFLSDLHTDFKWSPESREHFHQLCRLLKVSPSIPQQYAAHRWLSVLHVSLDTLRLLNPLLTYYSCYLQPSTLKLYKDIIQHAQSACEDMAALKQLKHLISSKTPTTDGKVRKARITEKLFTHHFTTTTTLHFYTSVLPSIDQYVKFFQSREPKMHLLHYKQEVILKNFLGNFIKPEFLNPEKLKETSLDDESLFLPKSLIFFGQQARKNLFKRDARDSLRVSFEKKARQAFVQAGKVLLAKMSLSNTAMKAFASLDPEIRGTTASMLYTDLPTLPQFAGDSRNSPRSPDLPHRANFLP